MGTGREGHSPARDGDPTAARVHGFDALNGLSALAGRSYRTTSEAAEAILKLIADQLGMRSAYVSRIDRARNELRILSAYNTLGGCDIIPGALHQLPDTF